jgi:hypothetical protein
VKSLDIENSSSSKFYLTKAENVKAQTASFSDFKIGELKNGFISKANSGSIKIESLLNDFSKVEINGQFVDIDISTNATCSYAVAADLTFPHYSFNNVTFKSQNKEMSHEVLQGSKGNASSTSQMNFNCQSCTITLN